MSYPKILRPRLHQAREIDELKKPLITNPKNSPVADKYVAAERKQKKSQIREYKKNHYRNCQNKIIWHAMAWA
ncbi:hypothetical protein RGU77_13615 [Actimicrobium sp. CCI2.3]|uniref:hypothetical protein n=1 Tax=Actimicrobium sp. CCI2.3 TaxID=3048616 RepID=UPI002AB4203B|nr:hypothetical protein [Actimicrobium sp. CCI2.3]MDY7575306.1 hypothetical protein [Actimicrobium sp. CCI2.3]